MIRQDENGIFKVVQDAQMPVGIPKRVMKQGDTIVHLENWEDRGAGLVAESAMVVPKQTSANGKSYTPIISVTDVHYSQKVIQDDNRIRLGKGHGLDIRKSVSYPNRKATDRGKLIPLKDVPQPGVDWQIEKPGDPEENC